MSSHVEITVLLFQERLGEKGVSLVVFDGVEHVVLDDEAAGDALLSVSDGSEQNGDSQKLIERMGYGRLIPGEAANQVAFTYSEASSVLSGVIGF